MKKKISLALAGIFILTAIFSACATAPTGPDDSASTNRSEIFDGIPDYNFDGTSIDFLANESLDSNARNWFDVDEVENGTIDQAIFERNARVGEAFNVKFTESYEKDVASTTTLVDQLIAAGDDSYDIICIPARFMLDLASKNYLLSYNTELYNIDLHGDSWIQWVNDIIKINGEMFFAFSDAMLSLYDFTHMILFNTKVLERYQLQSPYDYVENGTWTYDNMYYMVRQVSDDLNGNGSYDDDDMYGYVCPAYSVLPNYWISAGATSVKKIAGQGYFIFDLEGDIHFDTVYRRIFEIFKKKDFTWRETSSNANRYYDTDLTFQTNHALFADHTFYSVSQLREMESDFGIVPYPKWDESQGQYYSRVEAGTKTWGVLYIQDPELTGTIIEALARDSHEHLIHTYYDVTLQLKLTRDDKSIEMLDLIRDTMTYDPGDTLFCDEVRNGIFKDKFKNGDSNLSSLLASQSGGVQSQISEKNDYFKHMFGGV